MCFIEKVSYVCPHCMGDVADAEVQESYSRCQKWVEKYGKDGVEPKEEDCPNWSDGFEYLRPAADGTWCVAQCSADVRKREN